jgi:hypothetical protein
MLSPTALGLAPAIHRAVLFTKHLKTVALRVFRQQGTKTTPLYLGINMARKQWMALLFP